MKRSDSRGGNKEINERLLGAKKEKIFSVSDIVLLVLIVVLLLFSVVQRVWLSPVLISGHSMNRTIDDGDWLLMDKLKKPTYGDVVVIEISGETNYIKRVIGLPGETLFMKDNVVYRKKAGDGEKFEKVDEPYAYYSKPDSKLSFPAVTVEEGKIFFLGDNRCDSRDSRAIGQKSFETVVGVVPEWAIRSRKTLSSYYGTVVKIDNFILSLFGKKQNTGGLLSD